jgi:hypothetical protein
VPLQTAKFGPFTQGVIDRANPSLGLAGAVKKGRALIFTGLQQYRIRPGDAVAMTFQDDQATAADVTSVCAIVPFDDGALVVAHSTVTSAAYLYRVNSTLTAWYNAAGVLQSTTIARPVGALWTAIATAPDVLIAEGLGVAYIAHTEGADASTLAFPTKTFTQPGTIGTLTSDLDGSGGAENLYFLGVVSFKNHLWGWGMGAGTIAANVYRPELARYSQPSFGSFRSTDSITLGDRVRSQREKVVAGVVAGDSLFLGGPFKLSRVTGFGRNSWMREQLGDQKYGIVGPKAACAAGDWLYAWGPRGPYRCHASGSPEQRWDAIAAQVALVVNASKIVATYDEGEDLVKFFHDAGAGVRTVAAYHVARECWLGPDDDIGLAIRHATTISPVYASTAAPTVGPDGAPTNASTTNVTADGGRANWLAGDSVATTRVEYRRIGDAEWVVVVEVLPAGITSYDFVGLGSVTDYEWRVAHEKESQRSAYLGPGSGSRFTTLSTAAGLVPPTALALQQIGGFNGRADVLATWANSHIAPAKTEVQFFGPSVTVPEESLFGTVQTVDCPGSSVIVGTVDIIHGGGGFYWARARHTRSGFDPSAWSTPVAVEVSLSGELG